MKNLLLIARLARNHSLTLRSLQFLSRPYSSWTPFSLVRSKGLVLGSSSNAKQSPMIYHFVHSFVLGWWANATCKESHWRQMGQESLWNRLPVRGTATECQAPRAPDGKVVYFVNVPIPLRQAPPRSSSYIYIERRPCSLSSAQGRRG